MKDYKKLEERINRDKEITIASITELGYSRYDINQFIEAGILARAKRGIYTYLPEITIVEEPVIEDTPIVESTQVVENHQEESSKDDAYRYVNEGIKKITKRENKEAIQLFDLALQLDEKNPHARVGLIGAFVFLNDYENAYTELINFYNNRKDNSLLQNIYYYLLILKEHIDVDERLLEDIKLEIEENKDSIKKTSLNFKRLYNALNESDYLNALKYINYSISLDKQHKNYHITNHIYKALIVSTLKLKGINPFYNQEQVEETHPVVEQVIETPIVEETQVEEVIIVPETKIEDTIKTNLLLEAISNNDYELALSLLEQEQIDNPLEVIKTLLSKLAMIKSLITTNNPIKVVEVEPVHIVEEKHIEVSLETLETKETILDLPTTEETPIVEVQQVEPTFTQEQLINIAYKAYKDAYHIEQFDEATKNLRRYEYLNNVNGTRRNIDYHRIRIEQSKKDYEQNPERYLKKKALSKVIFDLKRAKRFDEALTAIEEFKSLGGLKNELVILVEAEIYYALGNYSKVSVILNGIRTSEEPSYFILASKIAFKNYKFQDALSYCQAYNERRPNQSPSNYQLMGDCYTKLGKNGKAIKSYRKAEEVSAQYNGKQLDLTGKINRQEMFAEFKKEERDARSLGKKK